MQAQNDRTMSGTLVHIMDAQTAEIGVYDFEVMRFERKSGQVFETIIGGAQYGHGCSSGRRRSRRVRLPPVHQAKTEQHGQDAGVDQSL